MLATVWMVTCAVLLLVGIGERTAPAVVCALVLGTAVTCQVHAWSVTADPSKRLRRLFVVPVLVGLGAPLMLAAPGVAADVPASVGLSTVFMAFWASVILLLNRATQRAYPATHQNPWQALLTVAAVSGIAASFGFVAQVSATTLQSPEMVCESENGIRTKPTQDGTLTVSFDGSAPRTYEVPNGQVTFEAPAYWYKADISYYMFGQEKPFDLSMITLPELRFITVVKRVVTFGQLRDGESDGLFTMTYSGGCTLEQSTDTTR